LTLDLVIYTLHVHNSFKAGISSVCHWSVDELLTVDYFFKQFAARQEDYEILSEINLVMMTSAVSLCDLLNAVGFRCPLLQLVF